MIFTEKLVNTRYNPMLVYIRWASMCCSIHENFYCLFQNDWKQLSVTAYNNCKFLLKDNQPY